MDSHYSLSFDGFQEPFARRASAAHHPASEIAGIDISQGGSAFHADPVDFLLRVIRHVACDFHFAARAELQRSIYCINEHLRIVREFPRLFPVKTSYDQACPVIFGKTGGDVYKERVAVRHPDVIQFQKIFY
jgi:hypothetical protein